ncbi:DNA replication and repair protein RecF, partial [Candidatus Aerophobetes bacterium]
TLIGPHRDDFLVLVDGVDLRSFGSQGEQRIAALSLKLAEMDLVKSKRGDYPIILLDDITSELDSQRRRFLMGLIQGERQVFITSTQPLSALVSPKGVYFFEVKDGKVRRKG